LSVRGETAKAALSVNDLPGDGRGFGSEEERDDIGATTERSRSRFPGDG
jgi:hypothetical protein